MEGAHICKPSNYLINSVLHFNTLILLPRLQHFLTENPLLISPRKSARKRHTPSAFHKAPISSVVLNISWQTKALPGQSCLIDFALRELVRTQAAPQLAGPPLRAAVIPGRSIYLENGLAAAPFCAGYIYASSSGSGAAVAVLASPRCTCRKPSVRFSAYFPFPVFPQSRSKWGQIPAVFFILQLAGSNSSL